MSYFHGRETGGHHLGLGPDLRRGRFGRHGELQSEWRILVSSKLTLRLLISCKSAKDLCLSGLGYGIRLGLDSGEKVKLRNSI